MIGGNDLIVLYERVRAGTLTDGEAIEEAKRLGRSAAATISGVLNTGARALVMTVPDLSLTPYAVNAKRVKDWKPALGSGNYLSLATIELKQ